MTFPTSPINLQTATVNGVSYEYDSALAVWNRTLSSSGVSTSWEITQTAHGFTAGKWVYYNGTSWALTDNTVTNGNAVEAPLLITSVATVNKFTVTSEGLVTGLSGLVSGETYFLSTAGNITSIMPTTNGIFVKAVFRAVSTTSGYVIPQPTLSAGNPPQGPTGPAGSVGPQGIQGVSGVSGVTARGVYAAGTAYAVNDLVTYNGTSYICSAPSTGNLPTNTSFFAIFAAQGSQGIQGIAGTNGSSQSFNKVTASFTQSAVTSTSLFYAADATSGAIVVTLPAASASNNTTISLKKINSNANSVSFIRAGADTIDGGTSAVINVQYASITIAADSVNNNWYIF